MQLARIRSEQGLLDEAEQLYQQTYATRERTIGPTHKHTLNATQGVADVCRERRDFDEAVWIQDTRGYSESLVAINDLALTYEMQRRYNDARILYEEALAGLEERRGEHDQYLLTTIANLAACYHSLGLYDQAEPLFKRAIATREQDFGSDHPATLNVYVLLGEM